jgi:hypothetical protein
MIGCTNIKHRIQGVSTGAGGHGLERCPATAFEGHDPPFQRLSSSFPFETVELFSRRSHEISLASAFGATEISKQQRTRRFLLARERAPGSETEADQLSQDDEE